MGDNPEGRFSRKLARVLDVMEIASNRYGYFRLSDIHFYFPDVVERTIARDLNQLVVAGFIEKTGSLYKWVSPKRFRMI